MSTILDRISTFVRDHTDLVIAGLAFVILGLALIVWLWSRQTSHLRREVRTLRRGAHEVAWSAEEPFTPPAASGNRVEEMNGRAVYTVAKPPPAPAVDPGPALSHDSMGWTMPPMARDADPDAVPLTRPGPLPPPPGQAPLPALPTSPAAAAAEPEASGGGAHWALPTEPVAPMVRSDDDSANRLSAASWAVSEEMEPTTAGLEMATQRFSLDDLGGGGASPGARWLAPAQSDASRDAAADDGDAELAPIEAPAPVTSPPAVAPAAPLAWERLGPAADDGVDTDPARATLWVPAGGPVDTAGETTDEGSTAAAEPLGFQAAEGPAGAEAVGPLTWQIEAVTPATNGSGSAHLVEDTHEVGAADIPARRDDQLTTHDASFLAYGSSHPRDDAPGRVVPFPAGIAAGDHVEADDAVTPATGHAPATLWAESAGAAADAEAVDDADGSDAADHDDTGAAASAAATGPAWSFGGAAPDIAPVSIRPLWRTDTTPVSTDAHDEAETSEQEQAVAGTDAVAHAHPVTEADAPHAEPVTGADVDVEPDAETDAVAAAATHLDAVAETGVDAAAETDADVVAETDADVVAETDAVAETVAETHPDTLAGTDADTDGEPAGEAGAAPHSEAAAEAGRPADAVAAAAPLVPAAVHDMAYAAWDAVTSVTDDPPGVRPVAQVADTTAYRAWDEATSEKVPPPDVPAPATGRDDGMFAPRPPAWGSPESTSPAPALPVGPAPGAERPFGSPWPVAPRVEDALSGTVPGGGLGPERAALPVPPPDVVAGGADAAGAPHSGAAEASSAGEPVATGAGALDDTVPVEATHGHDDDGHDILLVEDDENVGKVYRLLLESKGYSVRHATDGAAGLDMARGQRPDLILLDVMMPRMNGILFLQTLRAQPGMDAVPVVILSNFREPRLVERALALGAVEYMVKAQTRPDALLNAIPRWLRGERAFSS